MQRILKPVATIMLFTCLFTGTAISQKSKKDKEKKEERSGKSNEETGSGKDQKIKQPNKHRDMRLTFNEQGKLLNGYLPRYNPGVNRNDDCDKYKLTIRVLLPVDYFKDEKEKMDTKAKALYAAIKDPERKSTLARILSACKGKEDTTNYFKKLQTILNDTLMHTWKTDAGLMPNELVDYAKFMSAFNNYKDSKEKIKQANGLDQYMQFAPFRLMVKGVELDTACMDFVPVSNDDECKCLERNRKYIALQFTVPAGFLTREVALDSFQLTRKYYMKEVTVKWYNKMLGDHKNALQALSLFDKRIKSNAEKFESILDEIKGLQELLLECKDTVKEKSLEEKAAAKLCDLKSVLAAEFGEYDCKDNCKNLILCFESLRVWLAKLAWLNGDEIRLNPFSFTSNKFLVRTQNKEKKELENLKRVRNQAAIRLRFWETGIRHLEDSLLLMQGNAEWVQQAKLTLDSLLLLREAAVLTLAEELPDEPGDDLVKNIQEANKFLTVSQVNYKGWVVPYKTKEKNKAYQQDKMWLRNYYIDQMPAPLRQKLHYTYPENENVTLLLHNMTVGTSAIPEQTLTPFADSALFTMMAGEFVAQAASLYSSLTAIAPKVKMLVGAKKTVSNVKEITFSEIAATSANIQLTPAKLNSDSFINGLRDNVRYNLAILTIPGKNRTEKKYFNLNTEDPEFIYQNLLPYQSANATLSYARIETGRSINFQSGNFEQSRSEAIRYIDSNSRNVFGMSITYNSGQIDSVQRDGMKLNEFIERIKVLSVQMDTVLCFTERDTCYLNYLNALHQLNTAPVFIGESLTERKDTTPIYRTDKFPLKDSIAPYKNEYTLKLFAKKDDEMVFQYVIDKSFIRTGKFRYLQTAAGIAYTPNGGSITSVDTTNGGFKISRDEDRFRLIGGLRWYPAGLYNLKNPQSIVRERRWVHRLSLIAAVGVPKPLENIYLGGGFDLVPGLNLSAGVHFQQQNKFTIVNNQVLDKSVSYRGKAFYALTVDPALLINAITTLFKN